MLKQLLWSALYGAAVVGVGVISASCQAYGPQTELTSSGQGNYTFQTKPADPSEQVAAPVAANPKTLASPSSPGTPSSVSTPGNTSSAAAPNSPSAPAATGNPVRLPSLPHWHPVGEAEMVTPGNGGGAGHMWIPVPATRPSP